MCWVRWIGLSVRFLLVLFVCHSFTPFPSTSSSSFFSFVIATTDPVCSADAGPKCSACSDSKNNFNDLSGVPRFNRALTVESNNLGSYTWVTCSNGGQSCSYYWSDQSQAVKDLATTSSDSKSPANYTQSFTVYAGFGLVLALLTLLIGFSLLIFRYCCCCCCQGGTCGKRHPTKRTHCCGMKQLPGGSYGYPIAERWMTRGLLIVYFIVTVVFVGIGWSNGSQGVTDHANTAIKSTSSLAQLVQTTSTPTQKFLVNVLSNTASPFLQSIANLTQQTAPPHELSSDLLTILNQINGLPTGDTLFNFFNYTTSQLSMLNNSVTQCLTILNTLDSTTRSLNTTVTVTLQSQVNGLSSSVGLVLNDVSALQQNVTNVDTAVTNLTNSIDGTGSLIADLTSLNTNNPSSAQYAALNASLTSVELGSSTVPTGSTTQLDSFLAAYSAMPNFTVTSQHALLLNQRIDNLQQGAFFSSILSEISLTQKDVNQLVILLQQVNGTLGNVTGIVNSAITGALQPAQTILLQFNATIAQLPSFIPQLQGYLSQISQLNATVLPILIRLTTIIINVNTTLYQVPSQVDQISSLSSSLNSSLTVAVGSMNSLSSQLNSFQTQINNLNLTTYMSQRDQMQQQLTNATAQLNNGAYASALATALNATAAVNWTAAQIAVQTFNSSLASNRINTQFITDMSQLEVVHQGLLSLVRSVDSDFHNWQNGTCSTTTTKLCLTNTDCPTSESCVNVGLKRCKNTPTTLCPTGNECTSPDTCIVNMTNVVILQQALANFQSSPALQNSNSTLAQLNNINQARPTSTTSALSSQLNTASSSLQQFNSGSSTAQQQMNTAIQQFETGLTSLSTASLRNFLVNNVQPNVNRVDLSSPRKYINEYNSSITQIYQQQSNIIDAQHLSAALDIVINTKLPSYLTRLSASYLSALYSSAGLSSLVLNAASMVDEAAYLISVNNSNLISFSPGAVSWSAKYTNVLDLLSQSSALNQGSISFLLTLFNSILNATSSSSSINLYVDPTGSGRYDKDANGNSYPNNAHCYTDQCLQNTFNYYYTNKLSTTTSVPASISPQQALSTPFVIPLFISLVAISSLFFFRSAQATSCIASTALALIFIFLPLVFLFEAFMFPSLMVVNDVCYGGSNIFYQYLEARSSYFCTHDVNSLITATGTLTSCTVNVSSSASFNLNIPALVSALTTGSCSNLASDPLATIWSTARSSGFVTLPTTQANTFLSNTPKIRSSVASLITLYASQSQSAVSSLITDMSTALPCSSVASAFFSLPDTTCCQVGQSIYWAIASWYLIGFAMFLCGWPALLLGRKRFANEVWGPELERKMMDGEQVEAANLDDQTPLRADDLRITHIRGSGVNGGEEGGLAAMPMSTMPNDPALQGVHNYNESLQFVSSDTSSQTTGQHMNMNYGTATSSSNGALGVPISPHQSHPSQSMDLRVDYRGSDATPQQHTMNTLHPNNSHGDEVVTTLTYTPADASPSEI